MAVVPIFGSFNYYVWDTALHKWLRITRKEYNTLKKAGRDVMYLRNRTVESDDTNH